MQTVLALITQHNYGRNIKGIERNRFAVDGEAPVPVCVNI